MRRILLTVLLAAFTNAGAARAQLLDVLTAPKTLIERAAEARSTGDIATDNAIVLRVNKAMAAHGTIAASTEIYEQRLLVTGLFDDKAKYEAFHKDVKAVQGVKKLYWQVVWLPENDPKRKGLPSWTDSVALSAKASVRLTKAVEGKYVNYRTALDSYGTLYVLGRAYSKAEAESVVAALKDGDGIKKVVSLIDVRP